MKKTYLVALACFVVAVLCYVFAASSAAAGGFAFLGFIFEMMAWKKAADSGRIENKKVKPASTKIPWRRR